MLKFFNRMERTRNVVLFFFAVIMALSLVLFYAPTRNQVDTNLTRSRETAAKVGSEKITVAEVARQQENYSQFGGRGVSPKMLIDGMIRNKITKIEAAKLGLAASDAEVAEQLRKQLKSDDGQPIDQVKYARNVTEQFGSVQEYEDMIREGIIADELQVMITAGVLVSPDEVEKDYRRKNTKFDLSYVLVSSTELAAAIKPTDEELKTYFEANKKSYYISEPQKKIKYIFVNTEKVGEKLTLSDEELKAEYDKLPDDKKKAGINGQEIVLRVGKPELDSVVLQKGTELVTQLRKDGGKISEEAFAEFAKGQSENPRSASTGGKLPGLVRENPNKKDDPYQRLLTMQPGEVTEPIKFGTSYYILRRGEAVPKPFEDAKKEIEVSLRNRRAYSAAAELSQKIVDSLKQTKDIDKTAAEFAAQTNMSAKDMVRETGYIKTGDDVPEIGISPQFEEGIKPLEAVGDIGEKTPIQKGFAIPMLADRKEPRDAEFDEVKEQITEIVKLEQAKTKMEQIAKEIASGAVNAGALASLASSKGLKAQEQKAFIIGSPLGQGPSATTSEELEEAVYALKQGDVTKNAIKAGDSHYIVAATKRDEANMDDFTKQKDQLTQSMLMQKRGQVFSDYLSDIRQRMETAGEIKIYEDVLKKLEPEPESPIGDESAEG